MRKIMPFGTNVASFLEDRAFKIDLPNFKESMLKDFGDDSDNVADEFLKWYLIDTLLTNRFTKLPTAQEALGKLSYLVINEHVNKNSMFEITNRGIVELVKDTHCSMLRIWSVLKCFGLPGILTSEDLLEITGKINSKLEDSGDFQLPIFAYCSAPGSIFPGVHASLTNNPFMYKPFTPSDYVPYSVQAVEDVLAMRIIPGDAKPPRHIITLDQQWPKVRDTLRNTAYGKAANSIFSIFRGRPLVERITGGYESDILSVIHPACGMVKLLKCIDAVGPHMSAKLTGMALDSHDIMRAVQGVDNIQGAINIIRYQRKVAESNIESLADDVQDYLQRQHGVREPSSPQDGSRPGGYQSVQESMESQMQQVVSRHIEQALRATLGMEDGTNVDVNLHPVPQQPLTPQARQQNTATETNVTAFTQAQNLANQQQLRARLMDQLMWHPRKLPGQS